MRIGAVALLVAGAHRCANVTTGDCTGTTTACGHESAYRVSDAAHSTDIPFLAVHERLSSALAAPSFLQLHGNDEHCPTALLSDGSGSWPAVGILPALRQALSTAGIDTGRCGDGYPTRDCDLCGTDDLEGRASAGSLNACTTDGTSYGAMIHIEQQASARIPGGTQYEEMLGAIDQVIP